MYHRLSAILFLFLGGILLYWETHSHPFVFDDLVYLVENPIAKDANSFRYPFQFKEFALRSVNLGLSNDLSFNFITRPFCYLTFFVNYSLTGFDPAPYRITNILIHSLNAVLVWAIVSFWIHHSPKAKRLDSISRVATPLLISLVFLTHPLQTESVTYIIQRFTSLGTTLSLGSILAHHLASRDQTFYRWASLVLLALAMLTKEFAFIVPILMILSSTIMMAVPLKRALHQAWPAIALMPLIPALLILTSLAQNPQSPFTSALHLANGGIQDDAPARYCLTQPGVILTYLRLLILPSHLNIDPDISPVGHIINPGFWLPALILVTLFLCSARPYGSNSEDWHASAILLGVTWFFVSLTLDSTFIPLPDYMAEHRAYLPSVGAFLALISLLDLGRLKARRLPHLSGAWVPIAAVWILALSVTTWQRNKVWSSPVSLWSDAAEKSPNKSRVFVNLANSLYFAGDTLAAMNHYRRAIQLDPKNTAAHNNLSSLLIRSGDHHQATQVAIHGLESPSSIYHHLLYFNIAICHLSWKDRHTAKACLDAALRLAPKHIPSHLELGKLHFEDHDHEGALHHWRIAATYGPENPMLREAITELEQSVMSLAVQP